MEKSENTNQIPGTDESQNLEENSSSVDANDSEINPSIPEGENQVETPEITEETIVPHLVEESPEPVAETEIEEPEEIIPPDGTSVTAEEEIPVADETPVSHAPAMEETSVEISPVEAETIAEPSLVEEMPAEISPAEAETPAEPSLVEETNEVVVEEASETEVEEAAEHAQESEEDFNTYSREHLVEMLEKAVSESDLNAIKNRIALIKVTYLRKKKEDNLLKYEQFMAEGGAKEAFATEDDALDTRFNEFFNIYKANKARYNEEQEKLKLENLKKKTQILDELRVLVNSEETLKKTYDEFKNLQDRWKEVGMVPRTEINNLWQNYHFLVEKFFDKVKLNKELKDLDLRKNFEAKMALCEKTEELLLEPSLLKSFKKLQKYHEDWKELGPVPADKKDEIWERFKNATDKINELRREHYSKVEEEQGKNLETKNALCDQAEEVLGLQNESIKDWQENTGKVNELLKIWKSVGPVPQKQNAEIWNRFKSALDGFFANKKEFFDKLKDQQVHNYNVKVDICVQAEALKASTDWKKTTNELIRLQNDWKAIGPVPKKNSDKIWKRFRTACDEFFNAKSAFFSNVQSHEHENLEKKLDLMNRVKEYQFSENKTENLNALKNFQREWADIGHIPIKEKDKLQADFRTLINENLDRLKISEVEMTAVNYQSRLESMKHDPQGKKIISKERETLSAKISKMKEDINLWENNIGYLANSKNAAILKQEFEEKINKSKNDVKVLEAKLKMLRNQ